MSFTGFPIGTILQHATGHPFDYYVECGVVLSRGSDLGAEAGGVHVTGYVAGAGRMCTGNLHFYFRRAQLTLGSVCLTLHDFLTA